MQTDHKPLYVTAPSLASVDAFKDMVSRAWESGILTHNGPMVQELEKEVARQLNTKNVISVVNGTIALQLPFKAFKLKGEIITTPFSWIATCSSILWENCTPVFVDVNEDTFNIDPNKIEDAITHKTVGIMPVHVFSNPCDVDAIKLLADKYSLRVIYDAAHAMFVNHKGRSIMEYGDVAATSFHATKIFNTGEGGACFTTDDELHEQLKRIRFFGHDSNKDIVEDGMNGKMTEIHAALGLVNLGLTEAVLAKRKAIFDTYHSALSKYDFITFQKFDREEYNYSYMPIVFDTEERLLQVDARLKEQKIYARRYFYPSLNTIKTLGQYTEMPISESIAKRILCLPSHNNVTEDNIQNIIKIVN